MTFQEKEIKDWIEELKLRVPLFVNEMQDKKIPGKYRLSWSGDLTAGRHWGLAQTTFAVRVLYIFAKLDNHDGLRKILADYILSFEHEDGSFFDEYIRKKSRLYRLLRGLRLRDLDVLLNKENKRAETRQAIAALINLGYQPRKFYQPNILNESYIRKFIKKLNWANPWGASSHINHLIFFVHFNPNMKTGEKNVLIKYIENELKHYHRTDGSFYLKNMTVQNSYKIGSAMKILMGMAIIKKDLNWISNSLVDLCLNNEKYTNACEHFNKLYVLSRVTKHSNYREAEIREYVIKMACNWKQYYWPEFGGFSFNLGKSAMSYYGAIITKGFAEPDIHGTAMFCWGIQIVSDILRINNTLGLREPIL